MANDYTESDRAALSIRRGKLAAGIQDPTVRANYIAAQGNAGITNASAQAKLENDTHNDETTKALGAFKKGGTVKQTGLYKMHKGEVVVPAKKASKMRDILSGKQPSNKKKKVHLIPASEGHKPDGAHGRAAVKALGRTKTTGNFKRIEKAKGKGAAIAAYQNALKAHKAGE